MTLEANEDLHHPENDSEANKKKNLKQESEHQNKSWDTYHFLP